MAIIYCRKHVTPLLAGLLEVNPQKMWTFDRFFSEVTRILSKKKIHFYFVNKLAELRVYLDKSERLEDLQVGFQDFGEGGLGGRWVFVKSST